MLEQPDEVTDAQLLGDMDALADKLCVPVEEIETVREGVMLEQVEADTEALWLCERVPLTVEQMVGDVLTEDEEDRDSDPVPDMVPEALGQAEALMDPLPDMGPVPDTVVVGERV